TRDRIRVDLPHPGGPTIATMTGGGSVGVRSTRGTWSFFCTMSCARRPNLDAFTPEANVNALGLSRRPFSTSAVVTVRWLFFPDELAPSTELLRKAAFLLAFCLFLLG